MRRLQRPIPIPPDFGIPMPEPPRSQALPPELSVEEVAELLRTEAPIRLIDVREVWEREIVALPGAEPLDEALVERLLKSPPGEHRLVFMCHHGIRSLNAAAFFAAQGITEVYSMAGGIAAWAQRIDPSLPQY